MLYTFVDWQRRLLDPWLAGLRLGAGMPLWQRVLSAQHTLIERTLDAVDGRPVPVEMAVARDYPGVSSAETVAEGPFFRLVRLRGAASSPKILLVSPCSGYAGSVLSELAAALLSLGEVYFLDWSDARHVPLAHGRFGLAEQLALAFAALRAVGEPAHLVGVSQSGAVTLAAAALAAASPASLPSPRSLALLGTPLGLGQERSTADWLLAGLEPTGLERALVAVVPDRYPGAGRRVYPGLLQLLAVSFTNPATYLEAQAGLWNELLNGAPGMYDRLHADLHHVADVPAELFIETIEQILRQPVIGPNGLAVAGRDIPSAGLARLPILTIEAGNDELVGQGTTHAAQKLGNEGSRTLTIPGATHHGLFVGPTFARKVAPELRRFIQADE